MSKYKRLGPPRCSEVDKATG